MEKPISSHIIENWLKAWSISRELPLPVKFRSGLKVDVGFEKQKTRYVFTELNNDFIQLTKDIDEPWVFLKVCSPPSELKRYISKKWIVQPQGYMMSCFHPMTIPNIGLHNDYKLEITHYNSTSFIKIVTQKGEVASTGRLILVDDLAVYDRILTDDNHKRKGLATFLMKELEKIALSKGISKNFLVATEEGKSLYESLGWKIYSLYTSIVVPL
ncbi:GNAT family acetyltransferase [Flavobacteriaceae bacterium CRH]|nr:GNAT family acetyltransferase [Flavobacteriaceae bacterium CRH]